MVGRDYGIQQSFPRPLHHSDDRAVRGSGGQLRGGTSPGEGDVPANILILLDSSVSMRNLVSGDEGTYGIDWSVELSDGSIIFAENGRGFSKIITATGERDLTFAGGAINFRGTNRDSNCGNKNSQVNKSWAGAVTSSDIVYGVSTQNSGQIVAIDKDGKCVDVIGFNKTKIAIG